MCGFVGGFATHEPTPQTMGKSQKTPNREAVGYRIAVGMNGKAGDLGAAAPKGFSLRKLPEGGGFPEAPAQSAGELH